MLFVDNDQAKIPEADIFLNQSMSSDNDLGVAAGNALADVFTLGGFLASRQQHHPQAQMVCPIFDIPIMLLCQNFCGGHDCSLIGIVAGGDHGGHGNNGFSGTHVSLQKTVHHDIPGHVGFNFTDDALLSASQRKGQ